MPASADGSTQAPRCVLTLGPAYPLGVPTWSCDYTANGPGLVQYTGGTSTALIVRVNGAQVVFVSGNGQLQTVPFQANPGDSVGVTISSGDFRCSSCVTPPYIPYVPYLYLPYLGGPYFPYVGPVTYPSGDAVALVFDPGVPALPAVPAVPQSVAASGGRTQSA